MFGYAYGFVAGIPLQIGLDFTEMFKIDFFIGLSKFYLSVNKNHELIQLKINLFAAFLIYQIQLAEAFAISQTENIKNHQL